MLKTVDRALSVTVNGTTQVVAPGTTVAQLLGEWSGPLDGIAVACNRDVVPRSRWASTALVDGDHVEIVTAAAGG